MESSKDEIVNTPVSTGVKREKSLKDLVIENQTGKQKSKKGVSEKEAFKIETTSVKEALKIEASSEVMSKEKDIARTEVTKVKESKKDTTLNASKPVKANEKCRPLDKIVKAKVDNKEKSKARIEENSKAITEEKSKANAEDKPKAYEEETIIVNAEENLKANLKVNAEEKLKVIAEEKLKEKAQKNLKERVEKRLLDKSNDIVNNKPTKKVKVKAKVKPKVKPYPDRAHKDEGSTKKKTNKTSALIVVLCIISLLFATDIVSSAKIASFLKSMVKPDFIAISADAESQTIPVIGVSESNSISKGRLSTTAEDEQARLNQIAENSRVYCIISSSPYFENADSKGSLYISNPAESVYYTQVVIKTKNTEKEMYISPVIAPDEKVENDYLTDRSFTSGQYQANAYFNYYTKTGDSGTPEDYTYIGTMCAEVSIVIDNK